MLNKPYVEYDILDIYLISAITLPMSCGVAPVASIAWSGNSIETEASPFSALAIRGWLD